MVVLILGPETDDRERRHNGAVYEMAASDRSSAVRRLQSVGSFALVGAGLSLAYRITGLGLPCPWRMLTGTLCPLCGATHVGNDLLSFDFAAAWSDNAFVLSGAAVLAVLSGFWAVEALGGPAVRLPGALRNARLWWGLLGLTAVVFAVVRNL
ncbi:MAG: hypothetical protein CVT62_11425 [Actinobacteria bacterium HGW-Actinobacteria-2]|nr:MAG: hypothetical protein CVT62_11425 [Actinobacteria bacterium HGW-Actinobacteria-2]